MPPLPLPAIWRRTVSFMSEDLSMMGLDAPDPEVAALRRPPQSIESEQSVLGGLMLDNNAFDLVADVLVPEDFYRRDHRIIYEKIQEMCSAGRPADIVTVYGELDAEGKSQEAGGMAYLNSLVNATPAAANIRRYAEIVRDRSILRQLITAGDEIATSALSPEGADVAQLLDSAQAKVFAIDERSNKGKRGFRVLSDLAGDVTKELQQLYQMHSKDDVTGLPTGFRILDKMTSGLQKGDLIIVAGRPSMGKTSFAMNIAEYSGLTLKMQHQVDVVPRKNVFLHVDLKQRGLGGDNSWGMLPHNEYRLLEKKYAYSYVMQLVGDK